MWILSEVKRMKITDYEPKQLNNTITQIDKWYDKHIKLWCIQCKNSDGDQIGEAIYSDKTGAKIEYNRLIKEYGL